MKKTRTKQQRLIIRLHKESMASRMSLAVDIFKLQKNNPTVSSKFKRISKKIDSYNCRIIDKRAICGVGYGW
jgi:hypothetical protein